MRLSTICVLIGAACHEPRPFARYTYQRLNDVCQARWLCPTYAPEMQGNWRRQAVEVLLAIGLPLAVVVGAFLVAKGIIDVDGNDVRHEVAAARTGWLIVAVGTVALVLLAGWLVNEQLFGAFIDTPKPVRAVPASTRRLDRTRPQRMAGCRHGPYCHEAPDKRGAEGRHPRAGRRRDGVERRVIRAVNGHQRRETRPQGRSHRAA